jgi:hypothetical protein
VLPFTPPFWSGIGADTKDFYAAANLSARGGNPYDLRQIVTEQDRLFNMPRHLAASDPDYYHHAPYGYPPIFTASLRPVLAVSQPVFYLIAISLLIAAGMAGLWFTLAALRWRGRALPILFLLGSTTMALGLYSGNPSAILLLSAGAGTWLIATGRPIWGGAALSILLLKLPIGLPVAIALIATVPVMRAPLTSAWWRSHVRAAGGFLIATAIVLLTYLALARTAELTQWWTSLPTYESTLNPTGGVSGFAQQNLTGLPALLLDRFPAVVAVLLVTPAVIFAVGWALAPWWRNRTRLAASWLPAALALTAALSLSPYLHINDLLLAAIPLLVVASQPLNIVSRIALVTWAVGAPAQLVIRTLLPALFHTPAVAGTVGFGVVLTALLLASVAYSVRQAGIAASREQQRAGRQAAPAVDLAAAP